MILIRIRILYIYLKNIDFSLNYSYILMIIYNTIVIYE